MPRQSYIRMLRKHSALMDRLNQIKRENELVWSSLDESQKELLVYILSVTESALNQLITSPQVEEIIKRGKRIAPEIPFTS